MKEFKMGQIVYCSDLDNVWVVGHFAGVRDAGFTISRSLPDSLKRIGFGYHKCLSVEDYQKMLSRPKDKDLVWCWDTHNPFTRNMKFYDAKNNATFYSGSGRRDGVRFNHYEVIKDWRNKPDFTWAVTVFEKLED